MNRKSLLTIISSLLFAIGHAFAQDNEIGFVLGATLSPDTHRLNVPCRVLDPNCASANHTSGRISYEGVFGHRIANLHLVSFYVELPVLGIPERATRHTNLSSGNSIRASSRPEAALRRTSVVCGLAESLSM